MLMARLKKTSRLFVLLFVVNMIALKKVKLVQLGPGNRRASTSWSCVLNETILLE